MRRVRNAGTATALSLHGIPQLAIPLHLEQAVFAQRLVESGIGLALRGDQVEFVPRALQELAANGRFKAAALRFASLKPTRSPTRTSGRVELLNTSPGG
jgi:UDP:flavonoid glycosyltransferase YjiC (YdhE family)